MGPELATGLCVVEAEDGGSLIPDRISPNKLPEHQTHQAMQGQRPKGAKLRESHRDAAADGSAGTELGGAAQKQTILSAGGYPGNHVSAVQVNLGAGAIGGNKRELRQVASA